MIFDTDWWISVVVAGLIVSLAAAYLKDGIEALFRKIKIVLTVRRKQRRRDKARYIIFLADHPTLVTTLIVSASSGLNRVLSLMLMTILVPIFGHTMRLHPDWTFGIQLGADPMPSYKWFAIPVLLVSPLLAFSFLGDITTARKAAWRNARKNEAPNKSVHTRPISRPV
jgi:hypothetical protein